MSTVLADLPDSARQAVDRANASLARSKARLFAASRSADHAELELHKAVVRADALRDKMADIKYARPAA
jgi:hypothetical protein